MKKNWRLASVAAACILLASTSYAAKDTTSISNAIRLTGVPVLEFMDGQVAAKLVGKAKYKFSYIDGVLQTSESSNGDKGQYLYQRDGLLDRIVFSSGVVHIPRYDVEGNLYALVSTSGKAVRISGNVRAGRKLVVVEGNQIAAPALPTGANRVVPDALVNILVEVEGWESSVAAVGTDNTNKECDPPEINDPLRDGVTEARSLKSFKALAVAKPGSKSDETPGTTCAVVVITGPGGGGDGGGGGDSGGSPGGATGDTIPAENSPGTAPNDTPSQGVCMERAYRAWLQMDGFCRREPNARDRLACQDVKMRLYRDEIEYCRTL
ncbi:hypothetical protein F2P44_30550 [Massilia sp. CCM 8695]|uniref:FecR protein domain-containing protein n=1 Tax=Massilia frigida TaxID=2609281 RepID=A0ABX0NI67_9BURK|nr:hypothetical protein [Massilia frigida]NHZ83576.1 hypothetical protein [Massilia frigida]